MHIPNRNKHIIRSVQGKNSTLDLFLQTLDSKPLPTLTSPSVTTIPRTQHASCIDTTDAAANVNYPSGKKLIGNAFTKLIKEISKFNESLARHRQEAFEADIHKLYESDEKVNAKLHFEVAQKHLEYLYLKAYDELESKRKYQDAFGLCYDLVDQYVNYKKDRIISIVDKAARVAHKSLVNIKRGYKDHIIMDEDSEIILSSSQTPFNVGDEKKLQELVTKVVEKLDLKPEEISADLPTCVA